MEKSRGCAMKVTCRNTGQDSLCERSDEAGRWLLVRKKSCVAHV